MDALLMNSDHNGWNVCSACNAEISFFNWISFMCANEHVEEKRKSVYYFFSPYSRIMTSHSLAKGNSDCQCHSPSVECVYFSGSWFTWAQPRFYIIHFSDRFVFRPVTVVNSKVISIWSRAPLNDFTVFFFFYSFFPFSYPMEWAASTLHWAEEAQANEEYRDEY